MTSVRGGKGASSSSIGLCPGTAVSGQWEMMRVGGKALGKRTLQMQITCRVQESIQEAICHSVLHKIK